MLLHQQCTNHLLNCATITEMDGGKNNIIPSWKANIKHCAEFWHLIYVFCELDFDRASLLLKSQ